jgi:hypothetical protein
MKTKLSFCLIFLVSALHLTGCKKYADNHGPTIVSGTVYDYTTGKPIQGAKVVFGKVTEKDYYAEYESVFTDENGKYQLESVPDDKGTGDWFYMVSAHKEGYEITYADKGTGNFTEFFKVVNRYRKNNGVRLFLRPEIRINVKLKDVPPLLDHSIDSISTWFGVLEGPYPPYHKILNPNALLPWVKINNNYEINKSIVYLNQTFTLNLSSQNIYLDGDLPVTYFNQSYPGSQNSDTIIINY